jgi:ATP-dependent RNA helicase DDX52/ROK1
VIHSDRTRADRDKVVRAFREGKIWVLIATDLMARGLDFKGVEMVINYDLPTSAQTYIHRIGRTGRAGRKGEAITFFTEEDQPLMRPVINVIRNSECKVPQWLIDSLPKLIRDKKVRKNPEFLVKAKRASIDTTSGYDKAKIKHKLQMKEMSKSKKQREA